MSYELKPQRISVKPDGSQGHRKQMLRNSKVLKNSKENLLKINTEMMNNPVEKYKLFKQKF